HNSILSRYGVSGKAGAVQNVLEHALSDTKYLLGDQFTYPDILMTSALSQILHTNLIDTFPKVATYLGRCHDRPAWLRCIDEYHRRLEA
ncbi:glutathione binding-like protein, partial [Halomonas colorata]